MNNRYASLNRLDSCKAKLDELEIEYESFNEGQQIRILGYDYFPSTGILKKVRDKDFWHLVSGTTELLAFLKLTP